MLLIIYVLINLTHSRGLKSKMYDIQFVRIIIVNV